MVGSTVGGGWDAANAARLMPVLLLLGASSDFLLSSPSLSPGVVESVVVTMSGKVAEEGPLGTVFVVGVGDDDDDGSSSSAAAAAIILRSCAGDENSGMGNLLASGED